MKFGGTSVGNAKSIQSSAKIVAERVMHRPVVVVSAVAGVTDSLVSIVSTRSAKSRRTLFLKLKEKHLELLTDLGLDESLLDQLLNELSDVIDSLPAGICSPEARDLVVSFGERLSSRIFAAVLQGHEVTAKAYDAWSIGMTTTSVFGNSEPLESSPSAIRTALKNIKHVPVITGFIGKDINGKITTLGRGGSDYSTAIIGGALNASEIQIWKEVDGVLSTDPRIVPSAKLIPLLQYEEAGELAYFGAKVLHPKTMLPAMLKHVPIRVVNTFRPNGKGTLIVEKASENKSARAKAITSKKGTSVITVYSPEFFDGSGLMSKIFTCFEKHSISVDVVSTSVVSVSCSFSSTQNCKSLVKDLEHLGTVEVVHGCAVVCVVGAGMANARVVRKACGVFEALKIPVRMISESASGISITFLVSEENAHKSVVALHKALIT